MGYRFFLQKKGKKNYGPRRPKLGELVSSIEKPELVTDENDRLNPTDEWMEEFYQIKSEIKYERPTVCDESFDV